MSRKEKAGMKTAKLRDEKDVLDRQQHADIEAKKNLEENCQQLENRKQELEAQEKQMEARRVKIAGNVDKYKEELGRVRKDQRDMKDKLDQSRLVSLSILHTPSYLSLMSLFSLYYHFLTSVNHFYSYLSSNSHLTNYEKLK